MKVCQTFRLLEQKVRQAFQTCQTFCFRNLVVNQTQISSLPSLPFSELAPVKHTLNLSSINSLKSVLKSEETCHHSEHRYVKHGRYAFVFVHKFTRSGRSIQTSFLRSKKVYGELITDQMKVADKSNEFFVSTAKQLVQKLEKTNCKYITPAMVKII